MKIILNIGFEGKFSWLSLKYGLILNFRQVQYSIDECLFMEFSEIPGKPITHSVLEIEKTINLSSPKVRLNKKG